MSPGELIQDIEDFDSGEPFVESHGQDQYKGESKLRFSNQKIEVDPDIEVFPTNKLYPHTLKWNPLYTSPADEPRDKMPPVDIEIKQEETSGSGEAKVKQEHHGLRRSER